MRYRFLFVCSFWTGIALAATNSAPTSSSGSLWSSTPKGASTALAEIIETDVAVVGGGSGGFGAAWTAAYLGAKVVLVEKQGMLGGTSTIGGVNNWEPGMGGTGVPYRVWQKLQQKGDVAGVYRFERHCAWKKIWEKYTFPGGILVTDPCIGYEHTQRRHGPSMANEKWFSRYCHGVIFDPDAMSQAMQELLHETGNCRVLLNTAFVSAQHQNGRVSAIMLSDGTLVKAKIFIDATDGALCTQMGCTALMGRDKRSAFNEPGAPVDATNALNGASLIFRITPRPSGEAAAIDPLSADIPETCWWGNFPYSFMGRYPNGDIFVNMLPTMKGEDYVALGEDAARTECTRRVSAYWHYLQKTFEEFRYYKLHSIFPMMGIRETRRIVCDYMLNQNDLIAGIKNQTHTDMIAISDHPMDTHGGSGPNGELKSEYGIPYRCLLPKDTVNVLIASRAAGFSAIAASSCRLSRTMMQLGEAAGVAAHQAVTQNCALREVHPDDIRRVMSERIDAPIPRVIE